MFAIYRGRQYEVGENVRYQREGVVYLIPLNGAVNNGISVRHNDRDLIMNPTEDQLDELIGNFHKDPPIDVVWE